MEDLKDLLLKVSAFSKKRIVRFPERIVYHDIDFANRLLTNINIIGEHAELSVRELQMAKMVGWFFCSCFDELEVKIKDGIISDNNEKLAVKNIETFFKKEDFPLEIKKEIIENLKGINFFRQAENNIQKTVSDAITADLVCVKNVNHNLKLVYQELLLNNVSVSKLNWYEAIITIAESLNFYTPYGQTELAPQVKVQVENLKKARTKIVKQNEKALKKELDITDKELKKLKKNLNNLSGRDDRAVQTLFRTTIKNHYTLREMVDRKANIMITVNSIILSVVISGMASREVDHDLYYIPIITLAVCAAFSIFFAIMSTRPNKTQGQFTEEEIRSKQGNLLYFGNFHDMSPRDFEWGMLQMLNDSDYLYGSMIRDLYYLGIVIQKKFRHIRISLNIFLGGMITSLILYVIFSIIIHR